MCNGHAPRCSPVAQPPPYPTLPAAPQSRRDPPPPRPPAHPRVRPRSPLPGPHRFPNRMLRWLAAFESGDVRYIAPRIGGRAAWLQERMIARNVERLRGQHADDSRPRLASIEPNADRWWSSVEPAPPPDLPSLDATRRYMADTLETTLDLLAATPDETDDTLHFFRLALDHEDQLVEGLAELSQVKCLPAEAQRGLWPPLASRVPARAAGLFPPSAPSSARRARRLRARCTSIGRMKSRCPSSRSTPSPCSWAQFGEFVEDQGYDESRIGGRRKAGSGCAAMAAAVPRFVEQLRPGRFAPARRPAATRAAGPGRHPCELVRGRRLVPLGRPALAVRSRVGNRGAPRRRPADSCSATRGSGSPTARGPIRAVLAGRRFATRAAGRLVDERPARAARSAAPVRFARAGHELHRLSKLCLIGTGALARAMVSWPHAKIPGDPRPPRPSAHPRSRPRPALARSHRLPQAPSALAGRVRILRHALHRPLHRRPRGLAAGTHDRPQRRALARTPGGTRAPASLRSSRTPTAGGARPSPPCRPTCRASTPPGVFRFALDHEDQHGRPTIRCASCAAAGG